jgi:hypothetical protein
MLCLAPVRLCSLPTQRDTTPTFLLRESLIAPLIAPLSDCITRSSPQPHFTWKTSLHFWLYFINDGTSTRKPMGDQSTWRSHEFTAVPLLCSAMLIVLDPFHLAIIDCLSYIKLSGCHAGVVESVLLIRSSQVPRLPLSFPHNSATSPLIPSSIRYSTPIVLHSACSPGCVTVLASYSPRELA